MINIISNTNTIPDTDHNIKTAITVEYWNLTHTIHSALQEPVVNVNVKTNNQI